MAKKFVTDYKSVCGHKGDKLVQYSDSNDGQLNSICTPCLNAEIFFIQEVDTSEFDVILEGGHYIEIQMPKTK